MYSIFYFFDNLWLDLRLWLKERKRKNEPSKGFRPDDDDFIY